MLDKLELGEDKRTCKHIPGTEHGEDSVPEYGGTFSLPTFRSWCLARPCVVSVEGFRVLAGFWREPFSATVKRDCACAWLTGR